MATLSFKPTDEIITDYYDELNQFDWLDKTHEGAVRSAFQSLLQRCARRFDWTLVPEHSMTGRQRKRIVVDGVLIDDFRLTCGYWEAKDIHDDLEKEVHNKFEKGYPRDNILFQTPQRAILWQNKRQELDVDLTDSTQLIEVLQTFFAHRPQEYTEWEEAVEKFTDQVPALGRGLAKRIQEERGVNQEFATAFAAFHTICCDSLNPNLSEAAVEEMLIQHLLTERIFRTVFNNPDFIRRNIIGNEIEKVIDALTKQSFSRDAFLKKLDPFYKAIERAAGTRDDFSEKQGFLNTVYERFFRGFAVKIADTHGIVYTPQPVVDFMVRSVEKILQTQFNRSLSDSGVHIIDPFVGTGNFILRTMREIRPTALEDKYATELHCNEVMLLPYYIASLNIEHQFDEAAGHYQPFEGICFVDTFDLAQTPQLQFSFENTHRVEEQKETPMFVIIGNPPYNAGQVNENDNNKNRKYEVMDKQVKDTYADDSTAQYKSKIYDPYVKAIRWASDQIEKKEVKEGVVAFVTNNSFIGEKTFDGMRKHLSDDFDTIFALDLGGNARKREKVSDANVFGIKPGVSINFFIKRRDNPNPNAKIFYARVDESWSKEDILLYLSKTDYRNIEWKAITPDQRYTWLTKGLRPEFDTFIPMGTKEAKKRHGRRRYSISANVIFRTYSLGVSTNRDKWVYNFNRNALTENMTQMIDNYNAEVDRWKRHKNPKTHIDDFVDNDDKRIKWSRDLKKKLKNGHIAEFADSKIRQSLYRPFTQSHLYFDRTMTDQVLRFPSIFPTPESEIENRVICVAGIGDRKGFGCLATNVIPNIDLAFEKSQCFPFYTYDEWGKNRRQNITDWALKNFRAHYRDEAITKWDIFHYIYALLHHPDYREQYQVNLKRDLPHLPYAPDFWRFAKAGQQLGEIHIGYEEMPEYQLAFIENREVQINWSVEKMKLSKDKTQLVYNDFLTLDRIPAKALQYRLGNRSALEWVINQYRVKTDDRSGIVNDPNRADDLRYIVKLIGKVITVSLETVEIVEGLPALEA